MFTQGRRGKRGRTNTGSPSLLHNLYLTVASTSRKTILLHHLSGRRSEPSSQAALPALAAWADRRRAASSAGANNERGRAKLSSAGNTRLRGRRRGPRRGRGGPSRRPAASRPGGHRSRGESARYPAAARAPSSLRRQPRPGLPTPRRGCPRALRGSPAARPLPRPRRPGPRRRLGSAAPALPAAQPRPLPHVCKVLGVRPGVAWLRPGPGAGAAALGGLGPALRSGRARQLLLQHRRHFLPPNPAGSGAAAQEGKARPGQHFRDAALPRHGAAATALATGRGGEAQRRPPDIEADPEQGRACSQGPGRPATPAGQPPGPGPLPLPGRVAPTSPRGSLRRGA